MPISTSKEFLRPLKHNQLKYNMFVQAPRSSRYVHWFSNKAIMGPRWFNARVLTSDAWNCLKIMLEMFRRFLVFVTVWTIQGVEKTLWILLLQTAISDWEIQRLERFTEIFILSRTFKRVITAPFFLLDILKFPPPTSLRELRGQL